VGVLVCFHAHPDDECIGTGGIIAKAVSEGHRVVLVVATGGEFGEVPDDLTPGETLADRRRVETARSAEALGIDRVAWLGYLDSGMTGWEQNDHEHSFWQADVDEAAQRLAAILREEQATALTVYDWHGVYGHPDHVQVHRVGVKAGEMAEVPHIYESTMNRDHFMRVMAAARESGMEIGSPGESDDDFDPNAPADDGNPFGSPEAEITTMVDVTAFVGQKRASMAAHGSQISDSSFFLQMPDEAFRMSFGYEWFIHRGVTPTGTPSELGLVI
jgi:LmbE family N-acetylglucosaminyl deacetylase